MQMLEKKRFHMGEPKVWSQGVGEKGVIQKD